MSSNRGFTLTADTHMGSQNIYYHIHESYINFNWSSSTAASVFAGASSYAFSEGNMLAAVIAGVVTIWLIVWHFMKFRKLKKGAYEIVVDEKGRPIKSSVRSKQPGISVEVIGP